jgi:hypothetical protein
LTKVISLFSSASYVDFSSKEINDFVLWLTLLLLLLLSKLSFCKDLFLSWLNFWENLSTIVLNISVKSKRINLWNKVRLFVFSNLRLEKYFSEWSSIDFKITSTFFSLRALFILDISSGVGISSFPKLPILIN